VTLLAVSLFSVAVTENHRSRVKVILAIKLRICEYRYEFDTLIRALYPEAAAYLQKH